LGIAHVDVHDGGPRLGRRDGGVRDLFGRDGAVRALRYLGVITGNRTRNDDVMVHLSSPLERGSQVYIIFIIIFKESCGNFILAPVSTADAARGPGRRLEAPTVAFNAGCRLAPE